ncbi:hypothetical protein MO973_24165 [Paenibacillus sp. TRM 82003]|nr:hypothetical protein [Paenibacillus sp. TRM 82003]
MEFELDRAGKTPEGDKYYVYASVNGKKRCIGHLVGHDRSGLWSAYADGDLLACAREAEEAAQKLWVYDCARRTDDKRKPMWQCTVEERFHRLRKKIPRQAHFTDGVVREVHSIPIERRVRLQRDLVELIEDMEIQLMWWRKVKKEIAAAPKLMRYK